MEISLFLLIVLLNDFELPLFLLYLYDFSFGKILLKLWTAIGTAWIYCGPFFNAGSVIEVVTFSFYYVLILEFFV